MATLVVTNESDKRLRAATRRALGNSSVEAGVPLSLHVNLHPKRDSLIFGRETRRLAGTERIREVVGDTPFLISPTSFFQTNVRAAEILVRLVLDACRVFSVGATHASPLPVLDLYAGAGLFAIPLARAGHHVIAVEENRQAVADGEASLRLNKIPPERCRFIAKPVETALKELHRYRLPTANYQLVVLDPPREGCAPSVIGSVFGALRPRLAVYISCNPEALARDLKLIAGHRYTIESLQPVDMFPHTAHIETVVVMTGPQVEKWKSGKVEK
jgi:23S rRNA (uracil1939-C5)-methyltransferase